MVAISFKKRYAEKVESGTKLITIRKTKRVKAGDKLQLYTGMRTKGCRKLRDAVCVAVDSVSITPAGPFFGQPGWWPKDKNVFAERDGFQTYADMYDFFKIEYGFDEDDYIFNGYVIMWNAVEQPTRDRDNG
jgi:hypothetical protein